MVESDGKHVCNVCSLKDLASKLKQDPTSVESILEDISLYLSSSGQARVHFAADYSMDPATFLSCFKTVIHRTSDRREGEKKKEEQKEEEEEEESVAPTVELKMKVIFKDNLAEEKRLALGMWIFVTCNDYMHYLNCINQFLLWSRLLI